MCHMFGLSLASIKSVGHSVVQMWCGRWVAGNNVSSVRPHYNYGWNWKFLPFIFRPREGVPCCCISGYPLEYFVAKGLVLLRLLTPQLYEIKHQKQKSSKCALWERIFQSQIERGAEDLVWLTGRFMSGRVKTTTVHPKACSSQHWA